MDDLTLPNAPTPISPRPTQRNGNDRPPPFMDPLTQRRRNIGRAYR